MKIAVFSDVYSNKEALERVLRKMRKEDVDCLVCTGDLVGFGPNPNEVCKILREKEDLFAVRGDHDQAVLSGGKEGMNRLSRSGVDWTRKNINPEALKFLRSLPEYEGVLWEGYKILIIHGSPSNRLRGYLYEDISEKELWNYFNESGADLLLVGQSHTAFKKEIDGKYLLNPGSVGYFPGGGKNATYALLQIEKGEEPIIEFKKVKYNLKSFRKKMKKTGLPEELVPDA